MYCSNVLSSYNYKSVLHALVMVQLKSYIKDLTTKMEYFTLIFCSRILI